MEKNEENLSFPTWKDIQQAYADVLMEIREDSSRKETLASETIAELREQCTKSSNLAWHAITIAFLAILATILLMNVNREKSEAQWRQTMERINQGWINYLSQYDFVTQDGEGINYYNSEVGGDVNNGTTSPEEKEPKYR